MDNFNKVQGIVLAGVPESPVLLWFYTDIGVIEIVPICSIDRKLYEGVWLPATKQAGMCISQHEENLIADFLAKN